MVQKAIANTKVVNTAGRSGVVVEMITAGCDTGATMIINYTILLRQSSLACRNPKILGAELHCLLYKNKGDSLDRGTTVA